MDNIIRKEKFRLLINYISTFGKTKFVSLSYNQNTKSLKDVQGSPYLSCI